jgi:hypothetical protein
MPATLRRLSWLLPGLIVLLTVLAFLPTLRLKPDFPDAGARLEAIRRRLGGG